MVSVPPPPTPSPAAIHPPHHKALDGCNLSPRHDPPAPAVVCPPAAASRTAPLTPTNESAWWNPGLSAREPRRRGCLVKCTFRCPQTRTRNPVRPGTGWAVSASAEPRQRLRQGTGLGTAGLVLKWRAWHRQREPAAGLPAPAQPQPRGGGHSSDSLASLCVCSYAVCVFMYGDPHGSWKTGSSLQKHKAEWKKKQKTI